VNILPLLMAVGSNVRGVGVDFANYRNLLEFAMKRFNVIFKTVK